jgi:Uma2 family endonuclease
VRGERRDYADRQPGPQDLALVVEVADTTLQRDRILRKRLYARAGIVIYWIVNLTEKQVEVYTALSTASEQPDYQQRQDYDLTAEVPLLSDDKEVGRLAIRELLQ